MNNFRKILIIICIAITGCSRQSGNGNLLWLPGEEMRSDVETVVDPSLDLKNDGFIIRDTETGRKIMAKTETGAMYGKYALQRMERAGKASGRIDIKEEPSYERRILNHWDNLDNTVERGYAGHSIWHWGEALDAELINDYARLNASVGINGSVLNNVNATVCTSDVFLSNCKVICYN